MQGRENAKPEKVLLLLWSHTRQKLAEQLGSTFSQLGEVPHQQPPTQRGQNRHFSKSRGYRMNYVMEQRGQKKVAQRRQLYFILFNYITLLTSALLELVRFHVQSKSVKKVHFGAKPFEVVG